MQIRTLFALSTTTLALLLGAAGCAVERGQESVGAYVDDATITTQIKTRLIDNREVDAGAISVETLKGTVSLSGFAETAAERSTAETIARGVKGVRSVNNNIVVRP